jgi:hypothetical protein
MQTTVKTKVTVATIYVVFADKTKASETRRVLFIGTPTKADVKKEYEKTLVDEIKKTTVCELEKINLDCDLTSVMLVKTVEDFIIDCAKTVTEFESTIID